MEKCCALKEVDDILRNGFPGMSNRADLVSRWKNAPLEPLTDQPTDPLDSDETEILSQPELLDIYIDEAEKRRLDREELRSLLRYLLEEGEDIPERLSSWVHREYAGRNPPVKRGRPRLFYRDLCITSAYMYLFFMVPEFSHEDAIEFIACRIGRDPETVRPIVRIVHAKTGMDWKGMREFLLQETP